MEHPSVVIIIREEGKFGGKDDDGIDLVLEGCKETNPKKGCCFFVFVTLLARISRLRL